ncbi:MAG TPA: ribosomal protein S18-alanine N-acetyltransferase [Polyangia bacterium]|jgi:ribosomal-protein-alanine N-acetyltransferase
MATPSRARRFEILPMRADDLDEVMEIERLSFRAPWSRRVFLEELERDWAHIDLIKERGGGVVAFCNHWLVRDEVHILNLATHPDARRQGHAARLMRHVVEFARTHKCRYLTLEVRRSNHGAIRLYRDFGFRPVGIRPNYYVEDQEDAIVMLLELEKA